MQREYVWDAEFVGGKPQDLPAIVVRAVLAEGDVVALDTPKVRIPIEGGH